MLGKGCDFFEVSLAVQLELFGSERLSYVYLRSLMELLQTLPRLSLPVMLPLTKRGSVD